MNALQLAELSLLTMSGQKMGDWKATTHKEGNLKLIWDVTTGALKGAEVLK